jgi:SAM-dependent methyltransferase
MKRTLERLSQRRQEIENRLSDRISQLQAKIKALEALRSRQEDSAAFSRLEESLKRPEPDSPRRRKRPSLLPRQDSDESSSQTPFNSEAAAALNELREAVRGHLELSREMFTAQSDIIRTQQELMKSWDKEWDALGSNHVGQIFKSLEWRVDRLQAGLEDATQLMATYVQLREQLSRLLAVLQEKELPTPAQVKAVTRPLTDITYAGFENRHRGSEQDVKRQQERYLPYFQNTEKTVLDLGCGRGEFLDLLGRNNIPAEGVDMNQQMVTQSCARGLNCRTGDILEALAAFQDGTLGGIFSSQVVEHLPPDYLRRMVDLAYMKLAPKSSIVLETVNPTSVFALVHIYTLDLSHQQPIHPQALQFLLASAGFQDVEIQYSAPLENEALQILPPESDSAALLNRNLDKLNQLLFGPANYAAVGKKI